MQLRCCGRCQPWRGHRCGWAHLSRMLLGLILTGATCRRAPELGRLLKLFPACSSFAGCAVLTVVTHDNCVMVCQLMQPRSGSARPGQCMIYTWVCIAMLLPVMTLC